MDLVGPNPSELTHQDLLKFFQLRKDHFVDCLGWDLLQDKKGEFDQYDCSANVRYILAFEGAECVAGARLLPTNNVYSNSETMHTYMLKDFVTNNLINERDVFQELPCRDDVWEITRLVASRPGHFAPLLHGINAFFLRNNVKHALTISPKRMPKLLNRAGYSPTAISNPLFFDGQEYVALQTPTLLQKVSRAA